jgi:Holliday junction DNA helicase RuvA
MIARLRGMLAERHADHVVVDCAGVGYLVSVSLATLAELGPAGSEATLRIHTHVTDGAIQLFGFAGEDERRAFELLTSVQGVGPRIAIAVLSGLEVAELARAIGRGDVAALTRVRGVGRKTAERLTLELRDKLAVLGASQAAGEGRTVSGGAGQIGTAARPALLDEVRAALCNLGYKPAEAERAVAHLDGQAAGASVAGLLRQALRAVQGA